MTALPTAPMELRPAAAIPDGPQWLYEPKWDGFRCLAHRDGDTVELRSKHGQPLARYFPEIVAALANFDTPEFSLDGELVVPSGNALVFDALQARIHPAASRIELLARTTPAYYLVFDLLRDAGGVYTEAPLSERRERLEAFAAQNFAATRIRLSPATQERAYVDAWFARVGRALDGIVAKRLDLPYRGATRDGGVKVKRTRTADCVVGGYRLAAKNTDRVGSLLLGLYDAAGKLDYIGFCSAFSAAERIALVERLQPLRGAPSFTGLAPGAAPSRWSRDPERAREYIALRPELVLEVAFDSVTAGRIRHGTRPVRWRDDKAARDCTHEQLDVAATALALLEL